MDISDEDRPTPPPSSLLSLSSSSYPHSHTTHTHLPIHPAQKHVDDLARARGEKVSDSDDKKDCKCNCKNSKCLKMYCDCFTNRGFCKGCNCVNCHNLPEYIDEVCVCKCVCVFVCVCMCKPGLSQNHTHTHELPSLPPSPLTSLSFSSQVEKAVKVCLERNSRAFQSKVQQGGAEQKVLSLSLLFTNSYMLARTYNRITALIHTHTHTHTHIHSSTRPHPPAGPCERLPLPQKQLPQEILRMLPSACPVRG